MSEGLFSSDREPCSPVPELSEIVNRIRAKGRQTESSREREGVAETRHDWDSGEVLDLLSQPLLELVDAARAVHRRYHENGEVQLASLLSIKTGACPEDCKYCAQSAHYAKTTGLRRETLLDVDDVLEKAKRARDAGASRFCMGAAWREVKDGEAFDSVIAMVKGVRALGMEACVTLGMLSEAQASRLAEAGLTAYNHNLDTSPEFYGEIVTTRTYQDRLETLERVRKAGIEVCCGGIIGMGETLGRPGAAIADARQSRPASGERTDQRSRRGAGHAFGRPAAGRSARPRAHGGGGAHPDAAVARQALGGTARAYERGADPLLPRRRQLDLLRR